MGELSLRHIPDLSDASGIGDFSESSFQIPTTNQHDLLLADDTMDFFNAANDTLNTPAPPRPHVQPPLTLAELTPRSKPARAAPIRSSLRPHPGIATPYRANLAQELSTALSEELSPFRNQEISFQIPASQTHDHDLLLSDDGDNFLDNEQPSLDASPRPTRHSPTLDQLVPLPTAQPASGVTPNHSTSQPVVSQQIPSLEGGFKECIPASLQVAAGGKFTESSSSSTAAVIPSMSESNPEIGNTRNSEADPKNGKGQAPSTTNLTERQRKHSGGDKAKRKRVTPSAAVSKPAKLRPLTATLARRLSNSGKKAVHALRRRALQVGSSSTTGVGIGRPAVERAGPSKPKVDADPKPIQGGGLADTLMSFGQKLLADAARLEQREKVDGVPEEDLSAVREAPSSIATESESHPTDSVSDIVSAYSAQPPAEGDYLTLSQLSPRKLGSAGPPSPSSPYPQEATVSEPHQLPAPSSSSSTRPLSPMRSSVKRAASSVNDIPTHQPKRSKTDYTPPAPSSSRELRPRKPALQSSRAKNAPTVASSSSGPSGLSRTRRVASVSAVKGADRAAKPTHLVTKPGIEPPVSRSRSRTLSKSVPGGDDGGEGAAQTKRGPVASKMPQGSRNAAFLSSSEGSRSGRSTSSQKENTSVEAEGLAVTDGRKPGQSITTAMDKQHANLAPAKPTRPQAFQFATSTRVEARTRTAESSSTSTLPPLKASRAAAAAHIIPDFKALHAMQESVLAVRRAEGVQPTVPVEFALATESRAQEREKFEEARRARELELERLAEERRRQQEMEEEAEIREMRRRAVPKANEVPEWYAFAPKRKARAGGGDGSAATGVGGS